MNKLAIITLLAVLTGSCATATGEAPQVSMVKLERGFMGLPKPPDCTQYHNNGHSIEWQNCMGVGPK